MSMTYPQDERTLATLEQLKEAIRTHNRIVVLSGAGISVPSGIPDFRSAHGRIPPSTAISMRKR